MSPSIYRLFLFVSIYSFLLVLIHSSFSLVKNCHCQMLTFILVIYLLLSHIFAVLLCTRHFDNLCIAFVSGIALPRVQFAKSHCKNNAHGNHWMVGSTLAEG